MLNPTSGTATGYGKSGHARISRSNAIIGPRKIKSGQSAHGPTSICAIDSAFALTGVITTPATERPPATAASLINAKSPRRAGIHTAGTSTYHPTNHGASAIKTSFSSNSGPNFATRSAAYGGHCESLPRNAIPARIVSGNATSSGSALSPTKITPCPHSGQNPRALGFKRDHAIVTSMPGGVLSVGVTMDERIRNLMDDRGHAELCFEVEDPDLANRVARALERVANEPHRWQPGIDGSVVRGLEEMGRMGTRLAGYVHDRLPTFPLPEGMGRRGDPWAHLPPLSPSLVDLVTRHRATEAA